MPAYKTKSNPDSRGLYRNLLDYNNFSQYGAYCKRAGHNGCPAFRKQEVIPCSKCMHRCDGFKESELEQHHLVPPEVTRITLDGEMYDVAIDPETGETLHA